MTLFQIFPRLILTSLRFVQKSLKLTDMQKRINKVLDLGCKNCDSSVIKRAARAEYDFLHHCIQIGSGAQPAFYPMKFRSSFLGGKDRAT
jgi:hypothetical protein